MTVTVAGFALLALLGLVIFSSGRGRIIIGALLGAVVGGMLSTVGSALVNGAGDLVAALVGAFT